MKKTEFSLGIVVQTAGIAACFSPDVLLSLVRRHSEGDWGDIAPDDVAENEFSLQHGFRLFSAYEVNGVRIWVVTEADRSVTTVLLPEEY